MLDELKINIKALNDLMWDGRLPWTDVERWLANFDDGFHSIEEQKLNALFLLSHFSYFNSAVLRELLRALYRDFVQYPIISRIRRTNGNPTKWSVIAPLYAAALRKVRFIGLGNPSASGTHLLYYFRQENELSTKLFVHPHELFVPDAAGNSTFVSDVDHVVFLDDFCGSGLQAGQYSRPLLTKIAKSAPHVRLSYYPLFATSEGLRAVRESTLFADVDTLCELDGTFRAVDPGSRYFRDVQAPLNRETAYQMCLRYGAQIEPKNPLGFAGNQLLLGFAHNIPDNTLPIFWSNGRSSRTWIPAFPRHHKQEGW